MCVQEYNRMQPEQMKLYTANAWKTANFTGAAIYGQLRNLSEYISDTPSQAPQISYEEFERRLAKAKAGGNNGDI